jgi:hypothetical protein
MADFPKTFATSMQHSEYVEKHVGMIVLSSHPVSVNKVLPMLKSFAQIPDIDIEGLPTSSRFQKFHLSASLYSRGDLLMCLSICGDPGEPISATSSLKLQVYIGSVPRLAVTC